MIQEEGLQKPKIGDVSPRIESGVLSFNFIMRYLRLCSIWRLNHLYWFCSNTLFVLIYYPFLFVLFEVFNNLVLLPISFSLYPNPQKVPFILRF
jgi:hypothetical protein